MKTEDKRVKKSRTRRFVKTMIIGTVGFIAGATVRVLVDAKVRPMLDNQASR